MWDEGYRCVPVPVAFTIKNGQQVEGARAPVVQACLGFGRSRNTLRWATGDNEVSECLTEVAGIGQSQVPQLGKAGTRRNLVPCRKTRVTFVTCSK